MRTTLDVDEDLLKAIMALTKEKSKGKAVSKALQEFVRAKHIARLRSKWGKTDLVDNRYALRHVEPR
jgi:Arc/MetJ family transcription regulator